VKQPVNVQAAAHCACHDAWMIFWAPGKIRRTLCFGKSHSAGSDCIHGGRRFENEPASDGT
jgi:hypothetical protein